MSPGKLSLVALFTFSIQAFAYDRVMSVEENLKVQSLDQTIAVIKNGVTSIWKINFNKTTLEIYFAADGQSSFSFNHFSMCIGQDIGELAKPFTFTAGNDKGESREFRVEASTPTTPVHVSAVCPKPGVIDELFLTSSSPGLFPADMKDILKARLTAREKEIVKNRAFEEAVQKNGLVNHYVYTGPNEVCLNRNGLSSCHYHFAVELKVQGYGADSDGFWTPELTAGALSLESYNSYLEAKAKNPRRQRTLATSSTLDGYASPPLGQIRFNVDGTFDIPYGSGERYSSDQIRPTHDCLLHARVLEGGQKLSLENVRGPKCHANLPYLNMIPQVLELAKDE